MSKAYYNENDPFAASWLRALIEEGLIADGTVDERDIRGVSPTDLVGYTQCHFFAGIGGWSYALRLAGWPDNRPVWTGSCPCQPFSAAGRGKGFADSRHLWPVWFSLLRERRPPVVFGEQVDKALGWLDLVYADLEGAGYACGAVDLPASSVGAFHRRQRLYWVADAGQEQRQRRENECRSIGANAAERYQEGTDDQRSGKSSPCPVELSTQYRRVERRPTPSERSAVSGCGESGVADTDGRESGDGYLQRGGRYGFQSQDQTATFWSACDWLPCSDGKLRPVEPGTFPLAHGVPARVGRLRGYGNAIVPQVAEAFIRAYLDGDAR